MEENKGLIVFEKAMNKRFVEMADIHGLKVFKANLENNFSGNALKNISKRLVSKQLLLSTVSDIRSFIEASRIKKIYFSTSEGYVSHNIIYRLKKQLPHLEYIALQHGVFPLKYARAKEFARSIVNTIGMAVFGVYPIGAGFGGIQLNAYYVYSQREKDFLVKYKKWEETRVQPRLDFIKAELLRQYQNSKLYQDPDTALFLMQCLNLAGLCSLEEEKRLTETTINYLARKYKKVLIKTHPACGHQLTNLKLSDNVALVKEMTEGFAKSKNAYSFFSTALIDAKIFKLKTTGISAKQLKIDEEIYKNFDLKIDFEDILINKV